MSAVISVRIPKELKESMKNFPYINWSEVVREAIEKRIREEKIKWALKVMNEISLKAKPKEASEEIIRRFRDERRKSSNGH
ncbi:MAG: ribbon-helix-helix domain-containing protein [archaeon GB-1867-035]|nr:ribbon-helix-helix domain-containing protein [Candidatus Culexmicrobium profundum]